jgi:hypothetical protein
LRTTRRSRRPIWACRMRQTLNADLRLR